MDDPGIHNYYRRWIRYHRSKNEQLEKDVQALKRKLELAHMALRRLGAEKGYESVDIYGTHCHSDVHFISDHGARQKKSREIQ